MMHDALMESNDGASLEDSSKMGEAIQNTTSCDKVVVGGENRCQKKETFKYWISGLLDDKRKCTPSCSGGSSSAPGPKCGFGFNNGMTLTFPRMPKDWMQEPCQVAGMMAGLYGNLRSKTCYCHAWL